MTQARHSRRHRVALALMAGAALLLLGLFLSLGVWQIERLAWKQDLIARVDARLEADPVAAPLPAAWDDITRDSDEYRKITAQGRFDHTHEVQVQAVTELGAGYWVVTPLVTTDATYLVNRGFVPTELRDPANRPNGQVAGQVTVTGLLRMSEPDGAFLRSNDPANNRWYSRDVAAIAADQGLATAPFFIDADDAPNAGGYPIGGLTIVAFRNSHLSYALTWFALAVGVLAAAFFVWRHERK